MADSMTVTTPGLADFLRELRELPQAMRQRVLLGAVATGASVIRKEAVRRAPMSMGDVSEGHPPPGTLKKAIYQTRMTQECTPQVEVWKVDVRQGKKARSTRRGKTEVNLDAYYASWVEYGHFTRTPGLTGNQHKKAVRAGTAGSQGARWIPPRPFMRPAFEAKSAEALKAMEDYIARELPKAMAAARYFKAIG